MALLRVTRKVFRSRMFIHTTSSLMKEENPEKDDGLKELVDRLVKEALHKERLKSLEQDVKRHDEENLLIKTIIDKVKTLGDDVIRQDKEILLMKRSMFQVMKDSRINIRKTNDLFKETWRIEAKGKENKCFIILKIILIASGVAGVIATLGVGIAEHYGS